MDRYCKLFAVLFLLTALPADLWAGDKPADVKNTTWNEIFSDVIGHYPLPDISNNDVDDGKVTKLAIPKNWEFNIEAKRYIASHTSYEFGEPNGSFTRPLSRLEFPINTWWLNFDLRRTCPRWSVGGRAGLSINRNSNGWMEDSDWATNDTASYMTNYSRSYSDVREAYLFRGDVDVNVSDWLHLPSSMELRPLFAFQFQRFSIMAHDGVQDNYNPGTTEALDGNAISFRQDWYAYMIGLRGTYSKDINKKITVKVRGEGEWGPALGYNKDHHLLRGSRFTFEKTSGNALYFSTGVDLVVAKTVTVGVGVDYLWIRTYGIHVWQDATSGGDGAWADGVRVWSDQLGLTARVSYAF